MQSQHAEFNLFALKYPVGFDSLMTIPSDWQVRHRNVKLYQLEAGSRIWFLEPLHETYPTGQWKEADLGSANPAVVFYRGAIDFTSRVGITDIEARGNQFASNQEEADHSRIPHAHGNKGTFLDEGTYKFSTGQ